MSGITIHCTNYPHQCIQDSELTRKFEEDTRDMYSKAITGLMRGNLLINFAFADFEEVSCDKWSCSKTPITDHSSMVTLV